MVALFVGALVLLARVLLVGLGGLCTLSASGQDAAWTVIWGVLSLILGFGLAGVGIVIFRALRRKNAPPAG